MTDSWAPPAPEVSSNFFQPASADDSFSGRVFTTSDSPKLFGNTEAFSEVYDVDLPGVMAIQTNGTWTVTPTP